MKTYKATFYGRENGSMGRFYGIETTVHGCDEKQANINLYKKWEHIMSLKLEEVKK